MKSVLVTGANKGIGFAVVEAALREQADIQILLGARDRERGDSARDQLVALNPSWDGRVQTIALDVTSDSSVQAASEQLRQYHPALTAVVNNAGIASGSMAEVLDVNVYGVRRVSEAFAPQLPERGRIVTVTSASGPNFVGACDPRRQAFFVDPTTGWEKLHDLMQRCETASEEDFAALGMGSGDPYGLSKACANNYNMDLASRYPHLLVNACTPGFIETDLTRPMLSGRTPEEAGMKTPADGARVIMRLLFGAVHGSGHYYGSDGLRSPLDRYRAPGDPEFTG